MAEDLTRRLAGELIVLQEITFGIFVEIMIKNA